MVIYSSLALFLCFLSCHQRSRHCGLEIIPSISHLGVHQLHSVYVALTCFSVPSAKLFVLGKKKEKGCLGCHSLFQLSLFWEEWFRQSELLCAAWNPITSGELPSASEEINTGSPHHLNHTHWKAQDHTALLQSSSAPFFHDHWKCFRN